MLHYLRDNGYSEVEMFGAIRQLLEWRGRGAAEVDWAGLKKSLKKQKKLLAFLRRFEHETEQEGPGFPLTQRP
jgi:hypothetical protein